MTAARSKQETAAKPPADDAEQGGLSAEAEKLIASGAAEPLTGEIVRAGAMVLTPASDYGMEYRFSDVIPSPEAWAEFEQVPIDDCLDRDLVIMDAMFLDSQLDNQDEWAIIMFHDVMDATPKTTATGSRLVLSRIQKVMHWPVADGERNLLPMVGKLTKTVSKTKGHSDYYNLI